MDRLVITDNCSECIVIRRDDERVSLFHENKIARSGKVIVLNPVEADKVAKFIKEK